LLLVLFDLASDLNILSVGCAIFWVVRISMQTLDDLERHFMLSRPAQVPRRLWTPELIMDIVTLYEKIPHQAQTTRP
jgi:hypothetical protein